MVTIFTSDNANEHVTGYIVFIIHDTSRNASCTVSVAEPRESGARASNHT